MYYEFVMTYKTGRVTTVNIPEEERKDQLAYIAEGMKSGWLVDYTERVIEEEW